MKLDMDGLKNILRPWKRFETLEFTHIDENGNPSLRYIVLGGSLSGQLLGIPEQVEDLNGNVLSKMRGKILGCNTSAFIFSDISGLMRRTFCLTGGKSSLVGRR